MDMNFDDIKNQMNKSVEKDKSTITSIVNNGGKNNAVSKLRRKMLIEIILMLIAIIILLFLPYFKPMEQLPNALYKIFVFITILMGSSYVIKMGLFLKKTNNFASNTSQSLRNLIYDAKLTLEIYKAFAIAASIILPIPAFLLKTGAKNGEYIEVFNKWIRLDVNTTEFILLIIGYLVFSIIIYLLTVYYTKTMYEKHVTELEEMLEELDS
jgi:hypothetical protein